MHNSTSKAHTACKGMPGEKELRLADAAYASTSNYIRRLPPGPRHPRRPYHQHTTGKCTPPWFLPSTTYQHHGQVPFVPLPQVQRVGDRAAWMSGVPYVEAAKPAPHLTHFRAGKRRCHLPKCHSAGKRSPPHSAYRTSKHSHI